MGALFLYSALRLIMVAIRNWAMDNKQEVSAHGTRLDDEAKRYCS